MKITNDLQVLGLSALASTIYGVLLKRASGSISELARITGKHRPAVYKAVSELLNNQLISQSSVGKRITYRAESPVALFNIQKKQSEKLSEIIPEYIKIYEKKDITPKISVMEGKRGIATAYERLMKGLEKKGKLFRIESPNDYAVNKKYYPLAYWKRANGKNGDIDKFVITNEKTNTKRRNSLNRFSKYVNEVPGEFEYNITQLITKDAVVYIDYQTETVIMIENKRLAEHQTYLFQKLFENL